MNLYEKDVCSYRHEYQEVLAKIRKKSTPRFEVILQDKECEKQFNKAIEETLKHFNEQVERAQESLRHAELIKELSYEQAMRLYKETHDNEYEDTFAFPDERQFFDSRENDNSNSVIRHIVNTLTKRYNVGAKFVDDLEKNLSKIKN